MRLIKLQNSLCGSPQTIHKQTQNYSNCHSSVLAKLLHSFQFYFANRTSLKFGYCKIKILYFRCSNFCFFMCVRKGNTKQNQNTVSFLMWARSIDFSLGMQEHFLYNILGLPQQHGPLTGSSRTHTKQRQVTFSLFRGLMKEGM